MTETEYLKLLKACIVDLGYTKENAKEIVKKGSDSGSILLAENFIARQAFVKDRNTDNIRQFRNVYMQLHDGVELENVEL